MAWPPYGFSSPGASRSRVVLSPAHDGWWYGYVAIASPAGEALSGVFGAEDAFGNVGYAYDHLEFACEVPR